MTNFGLVSFFILANIGLAYYDSWRIKNNLRIRHGVNAVVYILLIAIFFKMLTITKVIGLLMIRIPVFNTALNIFRDLPPIYLSRSTTSIIDKITNPIIRKVGYWTYSLIIFSSAIILILI